MKAQLKLIVRTPRQVVLDRSVTSLRLPTESGQVGLRHRVEPLVLAVEPGLVVIRTLDEVWFAGTAGGLLRCDGTLATLLTPLAVTGASEGEVIRTLEDALEQPNAELEARATLSRLQSTFCASYAKARKSSCERWGMVNDRLAK